MGSSNCLQNVVEIRLFRCNRCEKLPALGMLPCLRVLEIDSMKSVKCLDEDFYYQPAIEEERIISNSHDSSVLSVASATTVSFFPSLIVFKVDTVENLNEWVPMGNSFPSLEKLEIKLCPKLRSTPNSFPLLRELKLETINTKAVTSIFATGCLYTSLTAIAISWSPKLIYLPLGILLQNITPNLLKLSMEHCSNFQGFLEDDDLNNYYNNNGDADSELMLSFACPEINSNSNNTSKSLRQLYLTGCPVLKLLPDLRSFTSLRELSIHNCNELKESIAYDLKTLTFLEKLWFNFIQSEYEHPEYPADESLRIENRHKF